MAAVMKKMSQITKHFGKLKSFLLSKSTNQSKIILVENDEIINDETKVTETLNSFFTETVLNLKTPKYKTSSIVMDKNACHRNSGSS